MRRLGILGGTFDPPHIGHLILGEYAAEALDLDQVLYVPAADPPHKRDHDKSPAADRLAMLTLALADNPRFQVSRVDMDRPGPHYSVDTVAILQAAHPGAELYFVMGADSLRDLLTWHQPDVLIERCYLAVMPRPGVTISPDMHADTLPQLADRVRLIDAPLLEISSTAIVNRLRQGRSVRYVVPAPVLSYVHEQGLYS